MLKGLASGPSSSDACSSSSSGPFELEVGLLRLEVVRKIQRPSDQRESTPPIRPSLLPQRRPALPTRDGGVGSSDSRAKLFCAFLLASNKMELKRSTHGPCVQGPVDQGRSLTWRAPHGLLRDRERPVFTERLDSKTPLTIGRPGPRRAGRTQPGLCLRLYTQERPGQRERRIVRCIVRFSRIGTSQKAGEGD